MPAQATSPPAEKRESPGSAAARRRQTNAGEIEVAPGSRAAQEAATANDAGVAHGVKTAIANGVGVAPGGEAEVLPEEGLAAAPSTEAGRTFHLTAQRRF